MDLYDELLRLIDTLEDAELDYAVCGGIAVGFHGYVRFTRNIDLLIRAEDLDPLRSLAADCGFEHAQGEMLFGVGQPFQRIVYRYAKIENGDELTLDLLLVNPFLKDVWESRGIVLWQGRRVQVVSRSGLTKLKRIAGRDEDRLDLKKLESGGDEQGR